VRLGLFVDPSRRLFPNPRRIFLFRCSLLFLVSYIADSLSLFFEILRAKNTPPLLFSTKPTKYSLEVLFTPRRRRGRPPRHLSAKTPSLSNPPFLLPVFRRAGRSPPFPPHTTYDNVHPSRPVAGVHPSLSGLGIDYFYARRFFPPPLLGKEKTKPGFGNDFILPPDWGAGDSSCHNGPGFSFSPPPFLF